MDLVAAHMGLVLAAVLVSPCARAQAAGQTQPVKLAEQSAPDTHEAQPPRLESDVAKGRQTSAQCAAGDPQSECPQEPYESEWYGGWILGLDGLAILTTPIVVGVGVYALGGPIVHLSKGEPVRAAGSFGLRIGLPLALGGLVAANQKECAPTQDFCGVGNGVAIAAAAGLGALTAMVIDSAALAYRKVPVKRKTVRVDYAPTIALSHHSAVLSVSGTF